MRDHLLTKLEKLNLKMHKESKECGECFNICSSPDTRSKKNFSKRLKFLEEILKVCKASNRPGKVCFASVSNG